MGKTQSFEVCFAGSSPALASKPAGEHWFESSTLAMSAGVRLEVQGSRPQHGGIG